MQQKWQKLTKIAILGQFLVVFLGFQAFSAGLIFFIFQRVVINEIFQDQLSSCCIRIGIN